MLLGHSEVYTKMVPIWLIPRPNLELFLKTKYRIWPQLSRAKTSNDLLMTCRRSTFNYVFGDLQKSESWVVTVK